MLPEKDEHEGDTSAYTLCELQTDDSHCLPPGPTTCGTCVIHHVYRRRKSGLKDPEDHMGILDVLLLPGGDPKAWITQNRKVLLLYI